MSQENVRSTFFVMDSETKNSKKTLKSHICLKLSEINYSNIKLRNRGKRMWGGSKKLEGGSFTFIMPAPKHKRK